MPSQLLLGELAKFVGHRTGHAELSRAVSDRIPSEAIADLVHGAVGGPARQAFSAAGTARFVLKSEWQLERQIPLLFKMRHGDREQRDGRLVRMIRKRRAHQVLGERG